MVPATVNSRMGTMGSFWITDLCVDLDRLDSNSDTDRIEQHRPVNSGNRQTARYQFLAPQDPIHDKCGAVCLDDVAIIENALLGTNSDRLNVYRTLFWWQNNETRRFGHASFLPGRGVTKKWPTLVKSRAAELQVKFPI